MHIENVYKPSSLLSPRYWHTEYSQNRNKKKKNNTREALAIWIERCCGLLIRSKAWISAYIEKIQRVNYTNPTIQCPNIAGCWSNAKSKTVSKVNYWFFFCFGCHHRVSKRAECHGIYEVTFACNVLLFVQNHVKLEAIVTSCYRHRLQHSTKDWPLLLANDGQNNFCTLSYKFRPSKNLVKTF